MNKEHNEEDLIIEEQRAVYVYVNQANSCTIRQEASCCESEGLIVISKSNIDLLINALSRVKLEIEAIHIAERNQREPK